MRTLSILFILGSIALADIMPPSWSNHRVESANGRFYASIVEMYGVPIPGSDRTSCWQTFWMLSVHDAETDAVLWTTELAWDGYEGGLLSDDGKVFARVASFHAEVRVWREGALIAHYDGDELRLAPHRMLICGQHTFARAELAPVCKCFPEGALVLEDHAGGVRHVDLADGSLRF